MSEEMIPAPYVEVVAGPDSGRRAPLREGSTTLGRSGDNDVCLLDPVLSRHHCRVDVAGGVVKIADLESANGTYLNGAEIRESVVRDGDTVQIGDTMLRFFLSDKKTGNDAAEGTAPLVVVPAPPTQEAVSVTAGTPPPQPGAPVASAAAGASPSQPGASGAPAIPVVDLGFDSRDPDAPPGAKKPNWRPLLWGLAAVAILAAAASVIMRTPDEPPTPTIVRPQEPALLPFEIDYEKVIAGTGSVFRYHMTLTAANHLSIEIDDLAENRHVRKDAEVSSNSVIRLASQIERAGFFRMDEIQPGIASKGDLDVKDITLVADRRVKRLRVENRVEPQVFGDVREALETFGMNELGIWAIQYPRERLVELAEEAFTRARNLYEQRDISHGNIFQATRSFREAAFYLETVEPKPDFFADAVTGLNVAEEELNHRYEEQRFRADRAINLKEWQTAAEELRILREQIPNPDDPRNADATRKLLDVENRLKKGK